VRGVCRYIEQHLEDRLTLAMLAQQFRRSPFHLQRTFKSALESRPRPISTLAVFARSNKISRRTRRDHRPLRRRIWLQQPPLRTHRKQLGMTPDKYRRGAVAAVIRYTVARSPLGRMLIAATDKGICSIQFADESAKDDAQLVQGLIREFPSPFAARTMPQ